MFRKMLIAALLSTIGLGTMASTASANEGGRARVEMTRRDGVKAGKRLGRHRRHGRKHRRAVRIERKRERQIARHQRAR